MTRAVLTVRAAGDAITPAAFAIRTLLVRTSWDATGGFGWDYKRPTMRAIADTFAEERGLTLAALRGPCRSQDICRPRQELMWILRDKALWSLPQIGRFLGDRDHTTILYGVRRHQARLDAAAASRAAWDTAA